VGGEGPGAVLVFACDKKKMGPMMSQDAGEKTAFATFYHKGSEHDSVTVKIVANVL